MGSLTNIPAEAIDISPEGLEVANTYLRLGDLDKTASELSIQPELVSKYLEKREIRAYIDNVYMHTGFNNRFTMRAAMDAILAKKFQELDEAGVGSNKDIAELLELSHKMTMAELDKMIQLKKLESSNIKNQVNVQINEGISDGTRYGNLLQSILNVQ